MVLLTVLHYFGFLRFKKKLTIDKKTKAIKSSLPISNDIPATPVAPKINARTPSMKKLTDALSIIILILSYDVLISLF